jgi:MFS family permease
MSTTSDEPTGTQEAHSQVAEAPGKPRSLWRNRDYLLLWSGQMVSRLGSQMSGFAFPLLALLLTGSPLQAGLIGASRSLPYLFLSLPGGALIDRWNRKRVMILCDAGRAVALGSIPIVYALVGTVPLVQLYLTALVEGALFVFFDIAEVACLPHVVTKQQLPAATGQNQAADNTSALIGPSLGGVLYALSRMLPFLSDAISYAVSVVSLSLIRANFQDQRTAPRRALRVEIAEGLAWLWHQPLIRFISFLTGSLNFMFAGQGLIIIIIAQHQGASSQVIGLIFTIGAIGGIAGSLAGAPIQKRFSFPLVIIASCWLLALAYPFYLFVPNPFWLGAISAVLFVVGPIYNTTQFSYRLALIPDALQGRVNSAVRLIAYGFQPLGQALTGLLLQWVNVTPTLLFFVVFLALAAIAPTINPHVRHARPLAEVEAEMKQHAQVG